jgi:hypothetical protein
MIQLVSITGFSVFMAPFIALMVFAAVGIIGPAILTLIVWLMKFRGRQPSQTDDTN